MIELRPYEEGDEIGIRKLIFSTHNNIKWKSLDYWKWKYKNNPYGFKKNLIWVAEDQNEIIAHYAVIPVGFFINCNETNILLSLNTITNQKYRRRGLFIKLANKVYNEAKKMGYPLVYGFPNPLSINGFIKYLDWKIIDTFHYIGMILNEKNVIYHYLNNKKLKYLFRCYLKLKSFLNRQKLNDYIEVQEINSFGEDFDIFNKKWISLHPFSFSRDNKFMKWRYSDPTTINKVFITKDKEGINGILGLAISKEENLTIARILDLISLKNKLNQEALLIKALNYCKNEGVDLIITLKKNNKIFRKAGFINLHRNAFLGIKILDQNLMMKDFIFNLSMADIDF
ncbi:MAG: GNAT family N-acetyltransferase [Promethearchaeota archaeon]